MNGKGDKVRPRAITDAEWDRRHAKTFRKGEDHVGDEIVAEPDRLGSQIEEGGAEVA